jgi:gliding motility-associated-like protein
MKKIVVFCLLILTSELSGQNFQRSYKSANEDPDLINMVLLTSGNLIASGTSDFQLQPVLVGLSPEGDLLWQRGMNSALQQNNGFSALKMLALPNGNALVLFVNLNTVILPPVFIRAKVLIAEVSATDGTFVWQRYLGDEDAPVVYNDAVLLPDGILLTGYVSKQYSLAKISYQGDLIWQKNFSGPDPSEAYRLDGLVANSQGDIYAVGGEYGTNAFSLHKFDSDGSPIWSQRYEIAAPEDDRIFFEVNIALSADQRPVLWGTSADPGPVNSRVFLMETNPNDGQILVSKTWGIPGQAYYASDIALLNDNTFLLCMGNGNNGVLAQYIKYDLEDGLIWSIVDNKTSFTGSIERTQISPDGYYYNLSQRLTLTPLARTSILTRTDHLLTNKPDCCHRQAFLQFEDEFFDVSATNLTPANVFWALRPFTPVFETRNGTAETICVPPELPALNFNKTEVCTGGCVSVSWNTNIAPALQWQVNNEPSFVSDSVTSFCFDQPGDYRIVARSEQDSCARTVTLIRVRDQAPPGFTVLDSIVCPGECLRFRLDTILPAVAYEWTFEGGTPSEFIGQQPPPVCFQQAGMFNAQVKIEGCSAVSDSILSIEYKSLLIPNAFTPNADGVNDLFKPIISCPTVTYLFRIYNRWGQVVFETADAAAGWDGRYEGEEQPCDVYVWTVEISDVQEEGVVLQSLLGEVTLLR